MPDFTFEEVAALARVAGLALSDDDLTEVTHRLNVILAGVERISHPDLDTVDPVPFYPLDEVDYER